MPGHVDAVPVETGEGLSAPIVVVDGRTPNESATLKDVTSIGDLVCKRVGVAMMNARTDIFVPIIHVQDEMANIKGSLMDQTAEFVEMKELMNKLVSLQTPANASVPVVPDVSVVDLGGDETMGVPATAAGPSYAAAAAAVPTLAAPATVPGENPSSLNPSNVTVDAAGVHVVKSAVRSPFHARPAVNAPKPFDGKISDCEHHLRKMHYYLKLCNLAECDYVDYASTYLEGQADKLWAAESDKFKILNNGPVTWDQYCLTLRTNYGQIAPMTTYYREYENLSQTGTVVEYVARMKTVVSKLNGSILCPAEGQVIVHFLRNLKPAIARLCENNVPIGWWTSLSQVFEKALTFETNKAAMLGSEVKSETKVTPSISVGVKSAGVKKVKGKKGNAKGNESKNPDDKIFISKEEWARRKAASRCLMCGKIKHGTCTDKCAEPFLA